MQPGGPETCFLWSVFQHDLLPTPRSSGPYAARGGGQDSEPGFSLPQCGTIPFPALSFKHEDMGPWC